MVENFLDLVEKLKRLKIVECKEFKVRRCLAVVISEFEDRSIDLDCLFDYGYIRF